MSVNKVCYTNIEQLGRCAMVCWKAGIPLNVVGGNAAGKTDSFQQIIDSMNKKSERAYRLWKMLVSIQEPTDIGGVPCPDGEFVKYLVPKTIPFDCDDRGILLFDEVDRCSPQTQNAAMHLLLGGEINGHKLSPNVFVACTMNGSADLFTTQLSNAFKTRVCHIYVSRNASGNNESWQNWAAENGVTPIMRQFFETKGGEVKAYEDYAEFALPTNRTLVMADKIWKAAQSVSFKTDDIIMPLIAGVIGRGMASEFIAFTELCSDMPTPKDIFADPTKAPIPEKSNVAYACVMGVCDSASDDTLDSAVKYIIRMPAEICGYAARRLCGKYPKMHTNRDFISWAKKNANLIM